VGQSANPGSAEVNAKASTPESKNSISNCRSVMGFACRISWYNRGSASVPLPCSSTSIPRAPARRLVIDQHAKLHGSSSRRRSHDEMKIARVKAICDPAIGRVHQSGLSLHYPIARERPLAESQPLGGSIDASRVQGGTAKRGKILRALIAEVVLPETSSWPNRRQLQDRAHRPKRADDQRPFRRRPRVVG
jgi:hypothetical protein